MALDGRRVEKWISYGEALRIRAVLENRYRNERRRYSNSRPAPAVIVQQRFWLTREREHAGRPCKERNPPRTLVRPALTVVTKDCSSGGCIMSDGEWERKFTVPELAVLQGFPRDYKFCGTLTSQRRQVGNALPPQVAEAFARSGLGL